ncbi:NAD-dependent epimerase/dehydratase family protein [Ferrimonas balearica]|uniref:NAD-dependent epimerase/dehydratase family protein n=1 Tax=Ferrimonas balearica TaxID=44012 RepID=UPI001F34E740|nr:NAD-dependent epimerase/dehydratase family protein [Ferrimonas balearica]MBY6095219.1 NAD-dependent epimerase/dehydratase family protein [Ferrimonas balearica]
MKTALVVGATGATGSALVNALLTSDQYRAIHLVSRRTTHWRHREVIREHILPLSRIADLTTPYAIDEVYCCLGTTMKTAGSKAAFRAVDYGAVVALGQWAKENGVGQLHVISSKGANAGSRNFYLRTKGEMEQALSALDLPALYLYRPSLLSGERIDDRRGERFGEFILNGLTWLPGSAKWRPVPIDTLAQAMIERAHRHEGKGRFRIESEQILQLDSTASE